MAILGQQSINPLMKKKKKKTLNEMGMDSITPPIAKDTRNFPTTNPDFVPPQPRSSDVTFKGNLLGQKSVETGGKVLTPEEYKTTLGQKGPVTSNVQAVQETNPDLPTAIRNKVIADRRLQALSDIQVAQNTQDNSGLISQIGQEVNKADPLANQGGILETPTSVGAGVLGGIGAGIAGSTKAGAVLGTAVTPGVGTAIGAGVGLVTGVGITLGKMSFDERQNVKNANKLFTQSKTNIGAILTAVNKGNMSPSEAVIAFNNAKQDILTAEKHLQEENKGISKYLSGGYDEMVALQTWKEVNIGILETQLANSLIKPNPNLVFDFRELTSQ